jgi:hypothetical protein
MKILSTTQTIEALSKALTFNKKAYFPRFGDGDFLLISGLNKTLIVNAGANHQEYSPELQEELYDSIRISDPLYMKAVALEWKEEPGMIKGLFAPSNVEENVKTKIVEALDDSTYFNPIAFHYLSLFNPKVLKKFIKQHIFYQKKMFIGSASKENMEKFLGKINVYVETPKRNSYNSIDEWYGKILEYLDGIELIITCTGFASRVITKRLWNKNVVAHVIDLGSIVDPMDNNFQTRTCWRLKGKEVKKNYELHS